VLSEEPAEIARPDLPAALMPVIRQAMAKRPEHRFPDARAFAAELQRVQRDLGLPVTDLPHADPIAPPHPAQLAVEQPGDPIPSLDQTVLRPGREADRVADAPPPRRGGRLLVIAVFTVVVFAGLGFGISRLGLGGRTPVSTLTATPAATVPPAVLSAARPMNLTVVDNRTSVVLHWQLVPGNRYSLVVERATSSFRESPPTLLPAGTTTTTVDGLDPTKGYCFVVGAIVALGQPSTEAWSDPACIRGASVEGPGY
jgi:hypothetical protein